MKELAQLDLLQLDQFVFHLKVPLQHLVLALEPLCLLVCFRRGKVRLADGTLLRLGEYLVLLHQLVYLGMRVENASGAGMKRHTGVLHCVMMLTSRVDKGEVAAVEVCRIGPLLPERLEVLFEFANL